MEATTLLVNQMDNRPGKPETGGEDRREFPYG